MKSHFLSSPTPELSKSQQKEDDRDILVCLKNRFKLMTCETEWRVPPGNVLRRMKNYHFRQVRKCKGTRRRAGQCDGHCPAPLLATLNSSSPQRYMFPGCYFLGMPHGRRTLHWTCRTVVLPVHVDSANSYCQENTEQNSLHLGRGRWWKSETVRNNMIIHCFILHKHCSPVLSSDTSV